MRTIRYILIMMLIPAYMSVAGEISKVGTTAAQFLKIGVGARASAMGESYVAVANDASAIFWNPAGMAAMQNNEVMLVRTNWIAGMTYDFATIVMPIGQMGTFGLFYQGLTMGEMEVRTEYNPEGTGELFSASSFALGLSYAKMITSRFSFGITGKYIKEFIWHESASTFAVDLGIVYNTSLDGLRLGMAISNYGGKMRMDGKDLLRFIDIDPNLDGNNENIISRLNTEDYDIPIIFRVGLAYDAFNTDFHRLTVSMDGISPNDYKEHLNAGFEYAFRNMVFLRGGFKGIGINDREVGFSAGGGLKYTSSDGLGLNVDYAYVDFGRLGNVQRVSLSFLF
ncbi:MAG TPA: PorV/PorQ family protein [Caldithrix abyssi]|uniref:PorV/PorQ family protein n=1 Tax=Caldithrix abyssi TaxID=187145 RepID=A0A7V4UES4_CALAY|nr:PorV/PorQ family protein [Caldithrix abyssi]